MSADVRNPAGSRPCFWIVDSCLRDFRGHYFNYAKSLHDAAAAAGLECRVTGHREVIPALSQALPVEPIFRYDLHHTFANPLRKLESRGSSGRWLVQGLDLLRANLVFYRGLRASSLRLANQDSVVFAPMCDHRQLLAWSWWLRRFPAGSAPRLKLMMRFESVGRRTRSTLNSLANVAPGRNPELVTDSQRLQQDYAFARLPVRLIPIPHVEPHAPERESADSRVSTDGAVRFITVGDLREEKGFDVAAAAIALVSRNPSFARMEFSLQCNWNSRQTRRPPECDQLRALNAPNITLVETSLGEAAYARFIRDADVVLLPYRQHAYRARTSGVLVEAMALAKPAIVTANTWLSDQTAAFGSGLTFADGSAAQLADAMLQASRHIATLKNLAREARPRVTAFHNPHHCLKLILAR